jgi:thiamine pyrophosphate-dependent acetolactate synthase large subunit-like protein
VASGSFATIGHTRPKNLIQVIIDNGANGSAGFQRSFTAGHLHLDQVARASGIAQVSTVTKAEEVAPAIAASNSEHGPSVIVVGTEIGMPDGIAVIPLDPIEIRDRFMTSIGR